MSFNRTAQGEVNQAVVSLRRSTNHKAERGLAPAIPRMSVQKALPLGSPLARADVRLAQSWPNGL
jgi:hypothetical protein